MPNTILGVGGGRISHKKNKLKHYQHRLIVSRRDSLGHRATVRNVFNHVHRDNKRRDARSKRLMRFLIGFPVSAYEKTETRDGRLRLKGTDVDRKQKESSAPCALTPWRSARPASRG